MINLEAFMDLPASLVAQWQRIHLPMQETQVWSPGQEEPPEEEMTNHSSIPAWRTPWTEEPGRSQHMGSQRIRHDPKTSPRVSHSVVSNSLWPHALQLSRLLCPWGSPGKNTAVGCHSPLQGIFPTRGQNLGLLPCRQALHHLSHQRSLFSSVTPLCLIPCNPVDCSTPGLPIHHQLQEFTQTHVHWVSDAIQPSHLLLSPAPSTFNLSQHQGPFKWVSSSHQVARVLELQLRHQSFQWIFRTDFL